jgi:glycosyltransferase involved in cell wall biosynthesis
MIYLFIHQGYPGQYRHVVQHLAAQRGNRIYFISLAGDPPGFKARGIKRVTYVRPPAPANLNCHPLTVDLDLAIRRGALVADLCRKLRDHGVRPDVVVGHCGWGETLFVKEIFPDAPVLTYFEFYYHAHGVDMNFDPEFSSSAFHGPERVRTRNGIGLMAFDATDWGNTPTRWQRSLLPPEFRDRITVLHEGVDTERIRPDPAAQFAVPKKRVKLTRDDEVITYVARNLEPYRGFHVFMRAIPEIQRRRPQAQIVIVGGDKVTYGAPAMPGKTHRQMMLEELGDRIDLKRVHFVGQLKYERYLQLLAVSSAHIYLTYPFILSWSFVEAMASGCLIIGSSTPPVLEVLEDRVNGLTVDFFASHEVAERIDEVLSHPDRMQALRDGARRTAVERFDLKTHILPRWQHLFDDLANGRHPELDP